MKKIPALITALALAGGMVVAQASTYPAGEATPNEQTTSATADNPHEGLGAKTKRAFHRMGQATRNAMHRMGKKDKTSDTASSGDTRTMGSYGTGPSDNTRRQRMDDAYDHYKSKQK